MSLPSREWGRDMEWISHRYGEEKRYVQRRKDHEGFGCFETKSGDGFP